MRLRTGLSSGGSLPGSILWLRSKEKYALHDGDRHLHIGLVYIAPKGSAPGRLPTAAVPYELLQQDLTDVLASNGVALVAGDFNGRTGSASGISGIAVED